MSALKTVALIPARGGSKGILRKNLQLLAGIPLIAHSIRAAKQCERIDEVYVSTEDAEIAAIAQQWDAKVHHRPSDLASDTASSDSVLFDFANKVEFDRVVFIQCTSPLTTTTDFNSAFDLMNLNSYDSMISVTQDHGGFLCGGFRWTASGPTDYPLDTSRPRRQEIEPQYRENGAFYITTKQALLASKNRISGSIGLAVIPYYRSFEIDELVDLELLRSIYPQLMRQSNFPNISDIKLVIFDVDGVFTDGSVYLDKNGDEQLKFSRIDGKGIQLLREAGFSLAVISAENSPIVARRMDKLGITDVHLGIKDKIAIYEQLKASYHLADTQICFCGDDIQDIPVMSQVGFSCAPANAQLRVKTIAHFLSTFSGGAGFVRDVANLFID